MTKQHLGHRCPQELSAESWSLVSLGLAAAPRGSSHARVVRRRDLLRSVSRATFDGQVNNGPLRTQSGGGWAYHLPLVSHRHVPLARLQTTGVSGGLWPSGDPCHKVRPQVRAVPHRALRVLFVFLRFPFPVAPFFASLA